MDDFELQEILNRRRRYEQLAGSQSPQGRMVGNVYVNANPLEYLAQGLRARAGQKGLKTTEEEMRGVQQKRQAMDAEAMGAFSRLMQDQPARQIQPITPNDDEGNPNAPAQMDAQRANPRGAFEALMGAYNPQMKQAGMQGLMTSAQADAERVRKLQEQQLMLGVLQRSKSPQEAMAAGVPAELVKNYYEAPNLGKVKGIEVNGQVVNPMTGEPIGKPIPKQANPFSDLLITDTSGAIVPNAPLIKAKEGIAKSGASQNRTTVINKGADAFDVELGKLDAKELETLREGAKAGQSILGTVSNLRAAEKQGAYSGGGADARLAAANLIEGWTGIAPKGLVGSQIYNAEANKLILDRVKTLGANPSNADREFLQKTVPQLATNAQAREAMANWMEAQATRSIKAYQDADSYARKNRGLGGFNSFPSQPKTDNVFDAADAILRGGR